MSREIKFRAWDTEEGKWLDKEDAECLTMHLDGRYEIDMGWVKVFPDLIIEQYTGLKDKNGKEIYEGDIVKTNSPDRANFNAGAIVMQQQMYLIINTPTYGDARLSHSEPLGYYCDMECEIIGNIHENPELLEDK